MIHLLSETTAAMPVSPSAIPVLVVTAVLLAAIPVVAFLYWHKRCGKMASWKALLFGALGFIVTVRILEGGVHMLCIGMDNPVSRFINGNTVAYVLYGILMAGIFEECGRHLIIGHLLKKQQNRENAVMYGIGHGGIEVLAAMLPVVIIYLAIAVITSQQGADAALAMFSSAGVTDETLATVLGFGVTDGLLTVYERIVAMALHISLTVIVVYGLRCKTIRYLLLAILLHAIGDLGAALYQRGVVSIVVCEVWATVVVVPVVLYAVSLYRKMNAPAATEEAR